VVVEAGLDGRLCAVFVLEKTWRHGIVLSHIAGAASVILGLTVIIRPDALVQAVFFSPSSASISARYSSAICFPGGLRTLVLTPVPLEWQALAEWCDRLMRVKRNWVSLAGARGVPRT